MKVNCYVQLLLDFNLYNLNHFQVEHAFHRLHYIRFFFFLFLLLRVLGSLHITLANTVYCI